MRLVFTLCWIGPQPRRAQFPEYGKEQESRMDKATPLHLLPLSVAVAGHRHISRKYEKEIAQLLSAKFLELRKKYPSTPLRCLTSLSTASDMMFAEVALSLDMRDVEVVCVLPAEAQVWAEHLGGLEPDPERGGEMRRRVLSLAGQCAKTVVLDEEIGPGHRRRSQGVERYMARRCHLLFALWNGKEHGEGGSTGRMVTICATGRDESRPGHLGRTLLDSPEPRGIHHLRVEDTLEDPKPIGWSTDAQCAAGAQDNAMAGALLALDRYNRAARAAALDDDALVEHAAGYLPLPGSAHQQRLRRFMAIFAMADKLAVSFRDQTWRTLKVVFACALVMLVSFALYSNIEPHPLLLALYLAGFALGCATLLYEHSVQSLNQFVDCRVLAEALRIQIFFRLSGVDTMICDKYLRKFRAEVAWIRDALRCLDTTAPQAAIDQQLVKQSWIDGQNAYYSSRKKTEKTIYVLMEAGAKVCLGLGLLLALGLLAAPLLGQDQRIGQDLNKWLVLFIGFLPALAAILSSYVFRRGLQSHSKEYERMQPIFERAAALVGAMRLPQDAADFRAVVEELGLEALAENGDWLLLHRGRPIPGPQ